MADGHCRVTVVGEHKRVDLAVPAAAPIAEYVTMLARLVGQEELEALPAAWSLAVPGGPTLHPVSSLSEAGVQDGQLLYLRDAAEGEFEEPLVRDVDELVADVADSFGDLRWTARARAVCATVLGALGLAGACVAAAVRGGWPGTVAGPVAVGSAFVLILAAWLLRRATVELPPRLALPIALAAVPCAAVAGWFLPDPSHGNAIAAALGAMVGAGAALWAAPSAVTAAVLVFGVAGAAVTGLLAGLHANLAQGAATVAVVGYGMLLSAPWLAAQLAALWPTERASEEGMVRVMVHRARTLLFCWTAAVSLLLAVALAMLGSARGGYPPALAGCLAVAALLRAGTFRLLAEAAPVVVAGAVGLATTLLFAPDAMAAPGWVGPLALCVVGVLMAGAGVVLSFRRPAAGTAKRPPVLNVLGTLCGVAAVPLALGVFGLFQHLAAFGHHL
ncbi:type VII secretion integral membrane protein EccD [Kitasatospora sp. NPDC018619]|uniref:type VII secretion integral membrane protein EccD n=1 Tax=unclassified Kitasatospora TaxID=2633591 RepID=UPI0037B1A0ED